jgi:capsular polysaccharide export protein
MKTWRCGLVTSKGMLAIPNLAALLGVDKIKYVPYWSPYTRGGNVVFGWGRKPSSLQAKKFANRHQLPFVTVEDGFLRSSGLGVMGKPPLSLVMDDIGVHFDWRTPSRLEKLIADPPEYSKADWHYAKLCLSAMQDHRLSKYNLLEPEVPPPKSHILVVDQTRDDASLITQQDTEQVFFCLLQTALRNHPSQTICVRVHPDVVAGKKQGYLYPLPFQHARLVIESNKDSAWGQFDQITDLYTVSSLLGFEALIHQKIVVHCFGLPFYAGWGLTKDSMVCSWRNGSPQTLLSLFMAAYVQYPNYWDKSTQQMGGIDSAINAMLDHRYLFLRKRSHPKVRLVGISRWKRRWLKDFLDLWGMEEDPNSPHRVVWGMKDPDKPCYARIEDGFLRSKGLGALGHRPHSLVCDFSGGIYFNAERPSDLESLLNGYQLSQWEKHRAEKLLFFLKKHQITKYNLNESPYIPKDKKKKILVIGQVESDASIKYGRACFQNNQQFLNLVQLLNKNSPLIYKSHPDVVYECRINDGEPLDLNESNCIEFTVNSYLSLLEYVDEVHVMTSLSGFESLIRNKKVINYGLPFYSGWGLTDDIFISDRRKIKRDILSFIFIVYFLFPNYLHQ